MVDKIDINKGVVRGSGIPNYSNALGSNQREYLYIIESDAICLYVCQQNNQ